MNLWSVFVTGLFAGGLSCAAVQGGLLAGVLARRGEGSPVALRPESGGARSRLRGWPDAGPVGGFLLGKLVSHAMLGALLGLLGDAVQPTPAARAVLQVIAGVVMLVLALDLLGVKAVRRLIPQPPARVARFVRRSGRVGGVAAPTLLGFATVLIPCGITLGVEFLAVASGSAAAGAAIMGAFVLGTSPLFAVLGYAARRSATALRGRLAPVAAAAVALAGVLSVLSGLALTGSPVALALTPSAQPADAPQAVVEEGMQVIRIDVGPSSYEPAIVRARSSIPTRLLLATDNTDGCTTLFVVPTLGIQQQLPRSGETAVELGLLAAGTLRYTCGMGMYSGTIEVA